MNRPVLKTSELAHKAGVNKETIRFYEKKGLLPEPIRSNSGYRQYAQEDVDRLVFVKNAKDLGFALSEVKELLTLADGDVYRCVEVRQIAESKLDHINNQLKYLKKLKATLTRLVAECQRAKTIKHCPIIESLARGTR